MNAVEGAGFKVNKRKTRYPADTIDIFNCLLEGGNTEVLQGRIDEFYSVPRTDESIEGFETYCNIVTSHTWRVGASKKRRRASYLARRKATAGQGLGHDGYCRWRSRFDSSPHQPMNSAGSNA